MFKKVSLFCLKVWFTSVLLGPVLFWLWEYASPSSILSFLAYMAYALFYGSLLSLPSFLLLWAGTKYLSTRDWLVKYRRMVLAGGGLLLTLFPFIVFFWRDDPNIWSDEAVMCVCYLIPILGGIFWYPFPSTYADNLPV